MFLEIVLTIKLQGEGVERAVFTFVKYKCISQMY